MATYAKKSCYDCGILLPANEMTRVSVSSSRTIKNTATGRDLIGSLLGSNTSKRSLKKSFLSGGGRSITSSREVWKCYECAGLLTPAQQKLLDEQAAYDRAERTVMQKNISKHTILSESDKQKLDELKKILESTTRSKTPWITRLIQLGAVLISYALFPSTDGTPVSLPALITALVLIFLIEIISIGIWWIAFKASPKKRSQALLLMKKIKYVTKKFEELDNEFKKTKVSWSKEYKFTNTKLGLLKYKPSRYEDGYLHRYNSIFFNLNPIYLSLAVLSGGILAPLGWVYVYLIRRVKVSDSELEKILLELLRIEKNLSINLKTSINKFQKAKPPSETITKKTTHQTQKKESSAQLNSSWENYKGISDDELNKIINAKNQKKLLKQFINEALSSKNFKQIAYLVLLAEIAKADQKLTTEEQSFIADEGLDLAKKGMLDPEDLNLSRKISAITNSHKIILELFLKQTSNNKDERKKILDKLVELTAVDNELKEEEIEAVKGIASKMNISMSGVTRKFNNITKRLSEDSIIVDDNLDELIDEFLD